MISFFIRLPVHHHNADYISFFWDHWAYCGIFENGVLLVYTLEGVSSVANFITAYVVSIKPRLPFSNPQCVLCFQGNLFDIYFSNTAPIQFEII